MEGRLVFCLVFLSCLYGSVMTANILCISTPHVGHVFPAVQVGKVLKSKYNHTFTVVGDNNLINNPLMRDSGVTLIESKRLNEKDFAKKAEEVLRILANGDLLIFKVTEMFVEMCFGVLEDDYLMKQLMSKKYDIMITLPGFIGDCMNYVAYKLSLPIIHYGNYFDASYLGVPFNPSITPEYPFALYGESMSFLQRIRNHIYFYLKIFMTSLVVRSDLSMKYVPEKPITSSVELRRHVQFNLLDFDVLMDYPRPSMPNIAYVGGLNTRPPQTLNADFQSLVNSATEGIVVVSFGSVFETFPPGKLEVIFKAMKSVKSINFVMKYGTQPKKDGNIYLRPWIPQNDLLAHTNTKAFITHCGNSGQYEALYNAVPMIGVPVYGDQFYNAERMRLKGYGLYMHLLSIEADSLASMIEEVVKNPSYKEKILTASIIFKSRPGGSPSERAAYWVDHVIKFGGSYMHSIGTEIPWYIYSGLDVYLFVVSFFGLTCLLFVFTIRHICGKYCKKPKVKTN